jgi:hypothetical protein|tara:strand:- start:209 stop:382 length:174 start_codon:yes stop_codon:yes gene_type:complete
LENKGREIVATIIDDIIAGRDYKARTTVQDVLSTNSTNRVTELKKDHVETMFKEDDV